MKNKRLSLNTRIGELNEMLQETSMNYCRLKKIMLRIFNLTITNIRTPPTHMS